MTCVHLTIEGKCGAGLARGINDGPIPPMVCRSCAGYSGPSRGLGDMIAKATKLVGIKPCGGCQKRREFLNNKVSFGVETPASATP